MAAREWYWDTVERERAKARERLRLKRAMDPAFKAKQDANNRAWAVANAEKNAANQKAWRAAHRERLPSYGVKFMETSRAKYLWFKARARAKRRGVPFSLTIADVVVPEFCPVLGIRLNVERAPRNDPANPSLDRLVPELGYVPGNVQVVSYRANTLKNNATPGELLAIANWVLAHTLMRAAA
jgi:hypothetical protein